MKRVDDKLANRRSFESLEGRRHLAVTDLTFNGGSPRLIDYLNLGGDFAMAAAVRPDGKLWVVGSSDIPGGSPTNEIALARYNTNGTLDTSFDLDGKFSFDPEHGEFGTSATLAPDGRLYVTAGTGPD